MQPILHLMNDPVITFLPPSLFRKLGFISSQGDELYIFFCAFYSTRRMIEEKVEEQDEVEEKRKE